MIHRKQGSNMQGFTLVELMLATVFIALLLVAIATVVIQISGIYNKGITMKSVNQAGRAVVDDMKRTVGGSGIFGVDEALVSQDNKGGRLCTGAYSYIWNIGTAITDKEPQINNYAGLADKDTPIRLVRVRDNGGTYCKQVDKALLDINKADAVELLSTDLAVQYFDIAALTDASTGSRLYRVTMKISNADNDAINTAINTIDTACKPPADNSGYYNYCAVNQFEFTVQAGNKGGQ